ncbi:MAG: hypothetical protein E5X33_28535 [Mesorhizobium sp.]|uniref:hypothetical protein n=1 Tax=Mesorhizobium sp. TaxID=1871066 RepID=UPI000FE4BC7A|nr:hypothetical protein [Mesorhizobium sp.]RWI94686.1 MAG: hypothetical protein EOR22_11570 [Mesorhizobium sp.]TIR16578.1 MAG: hypothetical protein E5X33_28535 [Mesorhizobium sp.]
MAQAPKKPGAKGESLALRLDKKTRFILDFVSRAKGQTITTVVERAIYEAAAQVHVTDGENDYTWQDVWNEAEGARALKWATIKDLFPTYEEERRLNFARRHWPFFYTNERMHTAQTLYVEVLWPKIDEFIQIGDDNLHKNAWAAGEAMQAALSAAQIEPPAWPPKTKQKGGDFGPPPSRELDDEIPF